jgi:hypothetical protein
MLLSLPFNDITVSPIMFVMLFKIVDELDTTANVPLDGFG